MHPLPVIFLLVAWLLRLEEGRQVKGVTAVLHPEDAQQEAVHEELDAGPGQDGNTLCLGIKSPGAPDNKSNRGE